MKIAKWYNNQDIRLEKRPIPSPGPKEILVKVASCGICGSDIMEWYRLPRAPLVQGHEMGGEVVKVGTKVKTFLPGDRVFVAPKVSCGECYYCLKGHHPTCSEIPDRTTGAFAEYVLVPEAVACQGTYRLPNSLSFDQSTFIEPLACVIRAQRLARVTSGQTVLIVGCGMSGLLHIKLAKAKGCRVVATDIKPDRLKFAKSLGADMVLDARDDIAAILSDKKADAIILCASAMSAIDTAWQCLDKGGSVVFFAVPDPDKKVTVPINDFWTKEIRIITSYYCGPDDLKESMELLEDGTIVVENMISHHLILEDIQKGFDLVLEGQESIKVIIKPNGLDYL